MSTDPFDSLREHNPAPSDRLPEPPMAMAERIMSADSRPSRGRAWPGWVVATAAAVAVLVVGGVWMLWLGTGSDNVAGESTTTTGTPAVTATTGPDTTVSEAVANRIAALDTELSEARATLEAIDTASADISSQLEAAAPEERRALEVRLLALAADREAIEARISRIDTQLAELAPATVDTTMVPTTGTTIVTFNDGSGVVYLMIDDTAAIQPGPYLVPVDRPFAILSSIVTDPLYTTLGFLLAGPTPGEAEGVPAISSAIPAGTTLNGVSVKDGIATIDLSPEFVSGGGSLSMQARVSQVIYTATRFPEVDAVRFLIDGVPTTVFGGEGLEVDDPALRSDDDSLLPAILIETPAFWGQATNPADISGTANVFEATVSLALTDNEGLILWEGFTTATCGTGCRGDWEITIPYDVDEPQMGSIIAWESSARDGSQTNVREHPIWLVPAGGAGGEIVDQSRCSASGMIGPGPQQGLPPAVVATRDAVFNAAANCSWVILQDMTADGFTYSFGGGTDPIGYWMTLESRGDEPLSYLAGLLDTPYGVIEGGGYTYYVWPSAHAYQEGWSAVPQADREALRPYYDDEDFASFDEFGGYIGWRIGITDTGEWVYFVAGD